jgi:hypothetical protein
MRPSDCHRTLETAPAYGVESTDDAGLILFLLPGGRPRRLAGTGSPIHAGGLPRRLPLPLANRVLDLGSGVVLWASGASFNLYFNSLPARGSNSAPAADFARCRSSRGRHFADCESSAIRVANGA